MPETSQFNHFGPQAFTNPKPPTFYECGCCGHYHLINWNGDCRDDANRFTAGALDDKYGENNWSEVLSPAIDFEEYIEMVEQAHGIIINDPERFRQRYMDGTPAECDPAFDMFDSDPDQLSLPL